VLYDDFQVFENIFLSTWKFFYNVPQRRKEGGSAQGNTHFMLFRFVELKESVNFAQKRET
jgi:hypothetical protein